MINAALSSVIATMGHTDSLCIADAGLPIPSGPQRVDLALRPGTPSFLDVLETVLEELVVERAVVAKEIRKINPKVLAELTKLLEDVPVEFVSHEELKKLTKTSRGVVRSGECTPYANILLYSGVPF